MDILALIMRWAHILSAVTAVGGVFFIRFVLMPSAQAALSQEAHESLRAAILKRWQHIVHTCILLFLVSGFYNYLMITRHLHEDQPLYHMLFGIKFLLALAVFTLALMLSSTRSWSSAVRANARFWLAVLAFLAVAVIAMSSVMRALPHTSPSDEAPVTAQSAQQPQEV
ncbi:MAG: hypothetical protein IT364_15345 [Candidatus Hydrogenedentes bacterium]|nr:hypothetical protein [Candidatus Hydrogenedentota bacterium]